MTHENPTTPPARVLDRSGSDVRLDRGRSWDRRDPTSAVGGFTRTADRDCVDLAVAQRRGEFTAFFHVCDSDPCRCFDGLAQPDVWSADPDTDGPTDPETDAETKPAPHAAVPAPFSDSHPIPAAGADSIPDTGSDSPPGDLPLLRQRGGQRRGDRDALRDRDNAGRGDRPRVPWRGRRSPGGLHDDGLLRVGDLHYRLQWDGQRWRGDLAMLGDGRWFWLLLSLAVRRNGSRWDAGRVDLYVVGVERGDGEHLQRLGQRWRCAGDLSGGLT